MKILVLAGAALATFLIGKKVIEKKPAFSDKTLPRGIRNNNPGNIRLSADNWQGLRTEQTDGAFFQFEQPEYGIRAMTRVLQNYQGKHGINTIRGIISRWAPGIENNTAAYIAAVSRAVGVHPDERINVNEIMMPLVNAIIVHENGQNPYSLTTISAGIGLANRATA